MMTEGDVMTVEEIIQKTVNATVAKLKVAGLMKEKNQTAMQKTEELLRTYKLFSISGDPDAEKMILQIESALEIIKDDIYYDVIPMYYMKGNTREEIAETFNTSPTTISRNKKRLIEQLSAVLFSSDYIMQIYS